jgi:hypothetical protein
MEGKKQLCSSETYKIYSNMQMWRLQGKNRKKITNNKPSMLFVNLQIKGLRIKVF